MNFREKMRLRREIRLEAFTFSREYPDATERDVQQHLEAEFGGLGIDPTVLAALIALILELIKIFQDRS